MLHRSTVKMQLCSSLLVSWLLSISLLDCSVHGVVVQKLHKQHVDRPMSSFPAASRRQPAGVKLGEELTAKLQRLDDLMRIHNDVMEPKRKRSSPLDRLPVISMETKQRRNSKVAELPRRRTNPPAVDRIGMSRLPSRTQV